MDNNLMQGVKDPEALHLLGQTTVSPTGPGFVNPGTPAGALVSMEQLINPETSKDASKALMNNLIK